MLPAKGPQGGRWRCVGLATSAATGCQSRPPLARPGHGCSQAWLLPRSRGNACGPRAGLPHVHCRQKVASRGWGTGSPGGWASRRAAGKGLEVVAPEPGGEAGCAKVGTDMANSSPLPPLRGPVHQLMQEWAPWGASVRSPWGLSRKESGQRVRGRPGGGSERRVGVHWGPGRAWWAEWGAERGGIGDSDFACSAADHPGSSWGEGQAAGRDNEPALDPARMGTINPRGAGGRLLRWL